MPSERNTLRDTYTDEKKGYKVRRQVVQDDWGIQASDALTTETKNRFSRNRGKVQCTIDSFRRPNAVFGLCSRVTYRYTVTDILPLRHSW